MRLLHRTRRHFQETARIGLEATLTAAVAYAQIVGADDVCEQLLTIKRDVVRVRRRAEDRAEFPAAVNFTFDPAIADASAQIETHD